jgi:hypothetical protein
VLAKGARRRRGSKNRGLSTFKPPATAYGQGCQDPSAVSPAKRAQGPCESRLTRCQRPLGPSAARLHGLAAALPFAAQARGFDRSWRLEANLTAGQGSPRKEWVRFRSHRGRHGKRASTSRGAEGCLYASRKLHRGHAFWSARAGGAAKCRVRIEPMGGLGLSSGLPSEMVPISPENRHPHQDS